MQLSTSDTKVIAQVFDPESGPAKLEVIVDPSLPADRHVHEASQLQKLHAREKEAIKLVETFEKSGSRSADDKRAVYWKALLTLDAIVKDQPDYASALNNRAQLRRWYWGDRNLLCQPRSKPQPDRRAAAKSTLDDLKSSIELASPAKPTDAVAPSQGRLLAQAYTQLGAIYHTAAKDMGAAPECADDAYEVILESMSAWSKDEFEEEASRLFFLGGLYGNEVAKALAVHTNPQAKLCGSIVKEAMRKEMAMAL